MIAFKQVDFPPFGIGDPTFTRMAPSSEVAYWSAAEVSENAYDRGYFIGGGFTDLNWTFESEDGRLVVRCENGFVYVFFAGGAALTVPCRNRGYSAEVCFLELLRIDPNRLSAWVLLRR
jgi:hypothetical protein